MPCWGGLAFSRNALKAPSSTNAVNAATSERSFSASSSEVYSTWVDRLGSGNTTYPGRIIVTKEVGRIVDGKWQPLTTALPYGGGEVTYRYEFQYNPHRDSDLLSRIVFTPTWYDYQGNTYTAAQLDGSQRARTRIGSQAERNKFVNAQPLIKDDGCGKVNFNNLNDTNPTTGGITGFSKENGWVWVDESKARPSAVHGYHVGGWAISPDPEAGIGPGTARGDRSPAYLYCTTNVTETTTSTLTLQNVIYTSADADMEYGSALTGTYESYYDTQAYVEALNGSWGYTGAAGIAWTNVYGNYPVRVPLTVEVEEEPLPDVNRRISITKVADKDAVRQGGEEVTYTYTVKNMIPARYGDRGRMYFQGLSDDKCPNVGHVNGLTQFGNSYYLAAGGTATFQCKMDVTLQTTNIATATFNNREDGKVSTASASATVRIKDVNLPLPENRIRLAVSPQSDVVTPGENIVYTYRVTSLLSEYMSNECKKLYLKDMLDDSCQSPTWVSGGALEGNERYINPGETIEFTCTRPTSDADAGTVLSNQATATFTSKYDNKDSVATYATTVRVRQAMPTADRRVSVAKVADTNWLPYGGGHTTYRYTVRNLIPGDYADTDLGKMYLDDLSDDKCAPVTLVSKVATEKVGTQTKRVLYPGDSASYICSANLTETTTNIATLTATNAGDNAQSIETAQATVEVSTSPDYPAKSKWAKLEMTPSVQTLPNGGGNVTYTYKLTNLIPAKTVKGEDYGRLYLESINDDVCSGAGEALRAKLTTDTDAKHPAKRSLYLPAGESVTFTCNTAITETTTNTVKIQLSNIDPDADARMAPELTDSATVTVLPALPSSAERISVVKTAQEPGTGNAASDGKVFYDEYVTYTVTVKNEIPAAFTPYPEGKMYLVGVEDPLCSLQAPSTMHRDGNGRYLLPGEKAAWTCSHKVIDETTNNTATATFKHLSSSEESRVDSNTVTITAEARPVPGRIQCSTLVSGSDVRVANGRASSGVLATISNMNPDKQTFDTGALDNGTIPNFDYSDYYNNRYDFLGGTAAIAVNPRSSNEVFYSIRNVVNGPKWVVKNGQTVSEWPHNGIYKFDNATGTHTEMVRWADTESMVRLGFDASYTLWSLGDRGNIYSFKFEQDADGNSISDGYVKESHGEFKLPAGHGSFKDKASGDLVFDGLGNMWVITAAVGGGLGELYVVPASELEGNDGATAVFVGEMGKYEFNGLAFDDEGRLWATDKRNIGGTANNTESHLYLVDTASGKATDMGIAGNNIHDLASCALPKPELRINKTADPTGGPIPGEEITYLITIENIGNLHAIDMKFKDLIPKGSSYVPGTMEMTVGKTNASGDLIEPTEVEWQKMPDNADGTTYFHTAQSIKSPSVLIDGVIDYKKASDESAPPPIQIKFKVKPDYPQKATTNKEVCNQAETSFVGKTAVLSDDPSKPGFEDKSCTAVIQPNIGIDKKASVIDETGKAVSKTTVSRVGEEVTYHYTVSTNPTQEKFNYDSPADQPKGLPEVQRYNTKLDVRAGQTAPDKLPTRAAGGAQADPSLNAEYWQKMEGTEPLKDVKVADDMCVDAKGQSNVQAVTKRVPDFDENGDQKKDPNTGALLSKDVNTGDENNDGLLDPSEKWQFVCVAKITKPTENIATVTAKGHRSEELVNDTDKWFIDAPTFKVNKLAEATLTQEDVTQAGAGTVGAPTWKAIGDAIRPDAEGKGTAVYRIQLTNTSTVAGFADMLLDMPKPPEGVSITGMSIRTWKEDTSVDPPKRTSVVRQWHAGGGKYSYATPELKPGESTEFEVLVDYQIENLAGVDWTKLSTCTAASGNTPSTGLFNTVDMEADGDGEENNSACIPILPPNVDIQVYKFARNCDADQETCSLQGARFAIYDGKPSANGDFNEVCTTVPAADDTSAAGTQSTRVCSFFDNSVTVKDTSGAEVTISDHTFQSVPLEYNKSYWLMETQAPAGFTLLAGAIEFRILPDDPTTPGIDESGIYLWDGDHQAAKPQGDADGVVSVADALKKIQKVDEEGKPVTDEQGAPVYEEKTVKGVQLKIENSSAQAVLPKSGSWGFFPYLGVGIAAFIGAALITKKDAIRSRFRRKH